MEMEQHEFRQIEALHDALVDIESKQNRVTTIEFEKYRPLFLKESFDKLNYADIEQLSNDFIRRFNMYRPIEVMTPEGDTLFRIPQLFVQLKTVSPDNIDKVDRFRSDSKSNIPKYYSEATYGLLEAIMDSQKNVSEEGFSSYGEYIKALSDQYHTDVDQFNQLKQSGNKEPTTIPETPSTNINDVDGLDWT